MKPTNLVFLLSDQHNRDTSGCYGHSQIRTPHIDSLAEDGVRFDSAYTNCPICVPARASLATGRYVHEIRNWDNAFPYSGTVPGWGHRLIAEGHRVESIGKLHYRRDEDDDGFSKHIVPLNVVDGIGDVMGSVRESPPVRQGTRNGILEAGPGNSTYLEYDIDIANRACRWLQEAAASPDDKPWVLFVSFVCPHPPFIAPPELFDLYPLEDITLPVQNRPDERPQHRALDDLRDIMQYTEPFTEEQIRQVTAAYYGTCTHLDKQIGKVLQALSDTGLSEETRIIYTSDHGESMGRRGLWGKFTMYEESAAIPFVLAGPDVPQGKSSSTVVSLVDCYQTILEAVGVEPTPDEQELPGRSLWPIAQGEESARIAFSEYHAVGSKNAVFMVRDDQYKYVHYVDDQPQLFDLRNDPQELENLADSTNHQSARSTMESKLRDIVDPEVVDEQAKQDQHALIEKHGGRQKVLEKGTFINSPAPGETPRFHSAG